MKVRELLQIEIWSKETSRRILAWTRKILVRLGVVLGVLVVVIGVILAIEMSWLTSGERKVAGAALVEIDAMQNLVSASDGEFEARDKQAKEAIEAAERAAWTIRDKGAVSDLSYYLFETEEGRRETEFRINMQQRKFHETSEQLELVKKSDELNAEIRRESRSEVLKALR